MHLRPSIIISYHYMFCYYYASTSALYSTKNKDQAKILPQSKLLLYLPHTIIMQLFILHSVAIHTQQNGVTIRTSVSWTFVPHKEVFVQQQQPPFSAPVASMYQSVPTTSNPKYTGVQIKWNISNSPQKQVCMYIPSCSAMIFNRIVM